MTAMFDQAFAYLIQPDREGGYVNDPRDNGGETKYGISKKQYPHLDIKNLTIPQAKEIYRTDFWMKYRCEDMPWPIGYLLFDCVVNHRPLNPIRWLQEAVGCYPDGAIGPRTLAAVNACRDPIKVAARMTRLRVKYVKRLSDYPDYGDGWHNRHIEVLTEAVRGTFEIPPHPTQGGTHGTH